MAKENVLSKKQEDSDAPEWFYDDEGRRLGVIANERARVRWHAERGLDDPAKEHGIYSLPNFDPRNFQRTP